MSRRSLSRRSMLASLPALAAITGHGRAADRRHPDAELTDAVAELLRCDRELRELGRGRPEDLLDIPGAVDIEDRRWEALDVLVEVPAQSAAGFKAKAGALKSSGLCGTHCDYEMALVVAGSLADDLLAAPAA